MYTQYQVKKCDKNTLHSINCHNKIRKVSQNKFETITLTGKHAFDYSVTVQNKGTGEIKSTSFPTRKQALCFFMATVKKYN